MPLSSLQAARQARRTGYGPRELLLYALVAGAYVGAAKLGFRAALVADQVSPAWPPSGLALWALLTFGLRLWPAIWAGALVANLTTHVPLLPAAAISSGNTLEAVAAVWLLRRFAEVDRSLDRLRQVTALIVAAAIGSTTISATIGVTTLCVAGVQSWAQYGLLWRMWWLGDAMGDVLIAPLLLTVRSWTRRRPAREWAELATLETAAVTLSALVFTSDLTPLAAHPLEYIVFPLVIWSGLRFAHPGAALVSATISGIAIFGTLEGHGPFATPSVAPHESLILLQIFSGVMATSGVVLGAAIADRNRSESLRQTDHILATVLAEERDLKHAAPRIIQTVCDTFAWDVGIIWSADHSQPALKYVDSWRRDPRFDPFVADSRTRRFEHGVGLPGRVWKSAQPAWIYDVTLDPALPRAPVAARLGLHGGFAFPIVLEGRVLGIIEFFARDPRQVDRSLLTLMETTGAQIGQFIERRRAERRVAASEALNSAIVNAALDCVVTIDATGAVIEFNPAATHTFGFTREQAIGRDLADLVIPPSLRDRHRRALRRCVETGEGSLLGRRIEMPALRADGSEFLVELAISRVGDPDDPIFTAHMRDITDRRRTEDERELLLARERMTRLEAEAANRSKDQFLATVSHELRTPLTAILGWASMLRSRSFNPQRTQQIYESIERNAQTQAQIIGDLLDVSRIVTGQLRLDSVPVDVCAAAQLSLETIRPTTFAKNIVLRPEISSTPCVVSGDSARLQQIIWNLLSNAAKFTPEGGTITLAVRRDGSRVIIQVSDTGIGIPQHLLARVFERFWQADGSTTRVHGGLGLGLALVRHLVELHGGEVSVASPGEGLGATFTVSLPSRRAVELTFSEATTTPAVYPTVNLSQVSALIVDDDAETRRLFAEMLTGCGARVACAASAAEAFTIFEEEPADVIVMDIGMPNENGFSLLRRIRDHERGLGTPPTPAIAVTAYVGAGAKTDAIQAGFAAYVPKPAPAHELLSAIAQAIGSARRPDLRSQT